MQSLQDRLTCGKVCTKTHTVMQSMMQLLQANDQACSNMTACMVNVPGPMLMRGPARPEYHLPFSTSPSVGHAERTVTVHAQVSVH